MADFTDRIKLIYDVSADQAKAGFSQVKAGVGEAEGAFGKLKAGASGLWNQVGVAGPAAFAAVGVAAAGFVTKSIGAYTDLALAADKFATAAGIGTEEASRWIEVSGDLGVEADAVQAAMGRLNREAASGKLAEFGITADNANDRLIETLTYLANIPDEGARAKASFELLGKGGAALAPLMSDVGQLRDRLAEVQGGKLIDDADVQKAKDLRDTMDGLADTWDNVMLSVGGSLAPVIKLVGDLTQKVADLAVAGQEEGASWWEKIGSNLIINKPAIDAFGWAIDKVSGSTDDAAKAAPRLADAVSTLTEETDTAAESLTNLNTAMLAQFNSQLRYEDAIGTTADKVSDYTTKLKVSSDAAGGNAEANKATTEAANDAATAALAQAAAAVKLAEDQAAANGTILTAEQRNAALIVNLQQVANTLAPGNPLRVQLEGYIAQLGKIPTTADTTVALYGTEEARRQLEALIRLADQLGDKMVGNPFLMGGGGGSKSVPGSPAVPVPAGRSLGVSAFAMPAAVTNIAVSVSVPPGAPTAEIGRYVADALVLHERRVGTQRRP